MQWAPGSFDLCTSTSEDSMEETKNRTTEFTTEFASILARLIGLSDQISDIPALIWEQVLKLAMDYVAGYKLLREYAHLRIAFVGGGASQIKLNLRSLPTRRWAGIMGELGFQLAKQGYVVVTGGTPPKSIMYEVIRGARRCPGALTVCLDIEIPRGGDLMGVAPGIPVYTFGSLDPREAVAWSLSDYLAFGLAASVPRQRCFAQRRSRNSGIR